MFDDQNKRRNGCSVAINLIGLALIGVWALVRWVQQSVV